MNALKEIESAQEIDVRLQTNEVFVHLPHDTPLSAVPEAIHAAGYTPDQILWLSASGAWTDAGFLPQGWTTALPVTPPPEAQDGVWELKYERSDDGWQLDSAQPLESVPQVRDEGAK